MPRRLIQRAFLTWLEENSPRFAVGIRLGRRTDDGLNFSFVGINSAIGGVLTTWEISVFVTRETHDWDFLLNLDSVPKRVSGGYVCDLCPPDSRPVFPNRLALWTAELFEPFLEWVNDSLAKAKWLALHGSPDCATWARLLGDDAPAQTLGGGSFTINFSALVEGHAPREKRDESPVLLPCRI